MEGRQWSPKRFIIFQVVTLQRTTEVRSARDIHQQVKMRIVEWKEGRYCMLVENTICTSRAMVSKVASGMSEEAIAKTFTSLVLKGKIHTTVGLVILRGAGGVLSPDEIDLEPGQLFIGLLHQKHPSPIIPVVEVHEYYAVIPEFVLLDITEDTIELISEKLTGAASPVGIDAISLQQ